MARPDWLKQIDNGEPDVQLPRGTVDLDEPITVAPGADSCITGRRTILVAHDEGMDALVASGPVTVRDVQITTTAERGGAAFRCTPSVVNSELELTNVKVIPAGNNSAFRYGIVLNNCWNPTLTVKVRGYPWDYTEAALLDPRMEIALDLGNAQEARCDVMISEAGIGIKSLSSKQGDAEGIVITGRWIMHCRCCMHLEGAVYGGTPTPWASVSNIHLFYTGEGIFALHRSGLHVTHSNFCGSHLNPDGTIAMWFVDCPVLNCTDNEVWRTLPGPAFPAAGLGIVVDATDGAVVSRNQITKDLDLGLYTSASCRNIDSRFNRVNVVNPARRYMRLGHEQRD